MYNFDQRIVCTDSFGDFVDDFGDWSEVLDFLHSEAAAYEGEVQDAVDHVESCETDLEDARAELDEAVAKLGDLEETRDEIVQKMNPIF